jgi:hypothetical protein
MSLRKEIERCPVADDRNGKSGGIEPLSPGVDDWGNPRGHNVDSASPYDSDEKTKFTVPDCSYKGYDSYTWPEGRADVRDLPCHNEERQPDDYEEIKPNKR